MINATLYCRKCGDDAEAITFASEFEPEVGSEIADTQAHMDTQFVARCATCFACDWEVIGVEPLYFKDVWVLDDVRVRHEVPKRTQDGHTLH